ncbi:MAG: CHASE2 domain-containing protein [bacterium]
MSRLLHKAIFLGFFIGIVGVVVSLFHCAHTIEENAGLGLLFKLRGVREAPSDIVIVSIDEESSENLSVPDNPIRWPRSLHARLTENLSREGAKVIAFDMHFIESSSDHDDTLFAEAMRKARNVVLCDSLKAKEIPFSDNDGHYTGAHRIVKIVKPCAILARSAVATASFPLPRMPLKVNRYWTFQPGIGDSPTFPVVAFQLFTLHLYEEFIDLLEKASPRHVKNLPSDSDTILTTGTLSRLIGDIREIFEREPLIKERMLEALDHTYHISVDVTRYRLLKSLINMYGGANSRYINFYGPPRTITTIPYYKALQLGQGDSDDNQIDVKGKAVFVGSSGIVRSERKDIFSTVFSGPKGVFISGTEIAASAFSNILEDAALTPIRLPFYILIILFWGILMGIICRLLPLIVAALGVVSLSILYIIAVQYHFTMSHTVYPIVIPLFFQSPLAFLGAVLVNYTDTKKERQNIRDAFEYYLPKNVVDKVVKNIAYIKTESQVVNGIFLNSDIEQYTSISETMDPAELARFMNRYYETIFKPTRRYGGIISDIIGDSMMAVWIGSCTETTTRDKACYAALDIQKAIEQFNESTAIRQINTRIGLHSGPILLGHIGAIDHYEYRPVGDIVNTASRIEDLNKYLGTRILVSEDVIDQLDDFLTRDLGKFKLKGKNKQIVVHELICRSNESDEKQRRACAVFAKALAAFTRQSWDEAIEKFHQCMDTLKNDKPSQFYIELCERHKQYPPEESWNGVINMEQK